MEREDEEVKEEKLLETPAVLDKYKAAAKIANDVLLKVIEKCQPDADIAEVCEFGDKLIEEQLKGVYAAKKGKKVEKGFGFPTCVSVNEICGHFSPLKDESRKLAEGDVAKIDLGVHIDGYVAQLANTIVVSADKASKVQGKKADVILAAHNAFEAGVRLIREGKTNSDVTSAIQKITTAFDVRPLEGVLSHEVKKHLIDGNNVIINKDTPEMKVEEFTFEPGQVFVFDVVVSTGEGKARESDKRTTVFKRDLDNTYLLKLKLSREFFSEVAQKYPTLPFSLRMFENQTSAKVGTKEALEHGLLNDFPVLSEKAGQIVAQFKATIVLLKTGAVLLTTAPFDKARFETEKKIEDQEIIDLLAVSLDKKDQKKAKKKPKAEEGKGEEKKAEEKKDS